MMKLVFATILLSASCSGLTHQGHSDVITKKLMDEAAELRRQNEELAHANSLLKVDVHGLGDHLQKVKGAIRMSDDSHEHHAVHEKARIRVCEQQVSELSDGLAELGDAKRVKEVMERSQKEEKVLERQMLNAKKEQ